jgi:hypothetical protein
MCCKYYEREKFVHCERPQSECGDREGKNRPPLAIVAETVGEESAIILEAAWLTLIMGGGGGRLKT